MGLGQIKRPKFTVVIEVQLKQTLSELLQAFDYFLDCEEVDSYNVANFLIVFIEGRIFEDPDCNFQ